MVRNWLAWVLLGVVSVGLVAGCSGPDAPPKKTGGAT
jgi:hypothetical protein